MSLLRMYRTYQAGKTYLPLDDDGVRYFPMPEGICDDPTVHRYYLGIYGNVMIAQECLVSGVWGNGLSAPKYCLAYSGVKDEIYLARRVTGARDVPKRVRKQASEWGLADEWAPTLRRLDQHVSPHRYAALSTAFGDSTPEARDRTHFTCPDCGALLIGILALRDHRDHAHPSPRSH